MVDCVVCSFQRNICSLQVRLKGGQLRSLYVAFKNCPQAEKTRFNIRFHKATTCNETALNSTHTFKYHKQEMNLLVSMKYKTLRSETTCLKKKELLFAKQPNFEKRNFHLQVPKVFLGKAKHLTFDMAFAANFLTAHLFQPFQSCTLWCNPCTVSTVNFSTLYF